MPVNDCIREGPPPPDAQFQWCRQCSDPLAIIASAGSGRTGRDTVPESRLWHIQPGTANHGNWLPGVLITETQQTVSLWIKHVKEPGKRYVVEF